jgi:VWFA-related protein
MRRYVALALLLGVPASGHAESSRPPLPTFASGVDVVHVDVSVTTPKGGCVGDLEKAAFAIYDNGVPQELSVFAREEVPISVVLLIDSSSSMGSRIAMAKGAAKSFLRALKPADTVQLMQFDSRTRVVRGFTNDRQSLEESIDSIEVDGETALYDALYIALKDLAGQRRPEEMRRSAVVLLADGRDSRSRLTEDQVLDEARRAEAAVYTVGLPLALDEHAEVPRVKYFLNAVAQRTGGRSYFPKPVEDLREVYASIAEELRTRYSLAYVSQRQHRDKFHRLTILVPSRGDLVIRHREGYYVGAP